jgi:UDP-glucuronate 4-epimerase
MAWLVTGAAGFIGFHTARELLRRGEAVVGVDNLNDYYDPTLKQARLATLQSEANFEFIKLDLADEAAVADLFRTHDFEVVINLAAQAGVRYALENPKAYIASNIIGFQNLIDQARARPPRHFVFASTSSVYGANTNMPFSVAHNVDHPVSLYAATKKSNELVAHSYAHLFRLPCTGLRFFTVYGPWGRPDMALFKFTRNILAGEPIEVFNEGRHKRDFTYIDDIVDGVLRVANQPAEPDPTWTGDAPDPSTSNAPWRVYNIGNNEPVALMDFIAAIEDALGKKANMLMRPLQPGDVPETYADIDAISRATGFKPHTSMREGVGRFVEWYKDFYQVA